MPRRIFYSFHYELDNWRASQVRNIGIVKGNRPATGNEWETVKRGGEIAIERWIQNQLHGKSCTVVLIGERTASRKWIRHEIRESWEQGMGVVGVHIHQLKDRFGDQCEKGKNPFERVTVDGLNLAGVVKTYDPAWFWGGSRTTYSKIESNLSDWIEEALDIRSDYP